jgi:hypothetical protein
MLYYCKRHKKFVGCKDENGKIKYCKDCKDKNVCGYIKKEAPTQGDYVLDCDKSAIGAGYINLINDFLNAGKTVPSEWL